MNIDERRIIRWLIGGYIVWQILKPAAKGGKVGRFEDTSRQHNTIGTSTPFAT